MNLRPFAAFAPDAGGAPAAGAGAGAPAPAGGAAPPQAFAETLPEDIRGEAAFRDIKDLGSLAKSYLHAQKLIGRDPSSVVALPGADDAKGWAEVYAKLGRPEKPDAYTLDGKLPDGVTEDPALRTAFLARAHEAGLSNRQAKALYEWYNGEAATRGQAASAEAQRAEAAAVAALKGEWGAAYDQKLDQARRALAHYGGADLAAVLERTKLGNEPALVKTFAQLGAMLAEDGLAGKGGADNGMRSPAEAQQQINALRNDAKFMDDYMNKRAPGHGDAVKRMAALHQMAYPERV